MSLTTVPVRLIEKALDGVPSAPLLRSRSVTQPTATPRARPASSSPSAESQALSVTARTPAPTKPTPPRKPASAYW